MTSPTYLVAPSHVDKKPMKSPSLSSPTWFLDLVQEDLQTIETLMDNDLGSDVREVYALSHLLLNAGGKRLRPAMVALSARAVNPDISIEQIAPVGAAVEFVHMATLVHDDVVDNTSTRRGKPTANAVFGNGIAVLSGDYILARALRMLARTGNLQIVETVAQMTVDMSEGEVLEISSTGKYDLPESTYLEILRKKTAVFVEGCCRCGAMLANAEPAIEEALADYGYRLGMAFQLADDLLDYTGNPLVTGKPRGSDLKDGRATLPFLLAMEGATPKERELLLAAFGNINLCDTSVQEVCNLLTHYQAFDRTREAAECYVQQAAAALQILPTTHARECFLALTDFVVKRDM